MKLRYRLPLFYSLVFSVLLAAAMLTVYYLFANFRQEEFKDRISERGRTTAKLFIEVKEVDSLMMKIIDKNSFRKLYNERNYIFNEAFQLIYSSTDDTTVLWTQKELRSIRKHGEIFTSYNNFDVLGLRYGYQNKNYYILIYAQDHYGIRKLNYLRALLLGAFLIGTILLFIFSFVISKRAFAPLERMSKEIREITSKNLTVRVHEPEEKDEIRALSQSFNQMINRIETAYKSQRHFASNASHELLTPVTRIVTQLQILQKSKDTQPEIKASLAGISEDAYQLSDIISSLLLLSNIDPNDQHSFQAVRLDELIFYCASQIHKTDPAFKVHFEIENASNKELSLEIMGDLTLLRIAMMNLFKNANAYSSDGQVACTVTRYDDAIELQMVNTGKVPDIENPSDLFNMFSRGNNSAYKPGTGIGLYIVQRILEYHKATFQFTVEPPDLNKITLRFPAVF